MASVNGIECADLDDDGDTDILIFEDTNDRIYLLENIGGNNFQEPKNLLSEKTEALSLTLADLNNDNTSDLFFSVREDGAIYFMLGENGTTNFQNKRLVVDGLKALANFKVQDVTGDDRPDVITSDISTDLILLIKNIDGAFDDVEPAIIDSLDRPSALEIVDLDNDGDSDLAVSAFFDASLMWYENVDGQGTFSEKVSIDSSVVYARRIFSGDINKDSKPELVCASRFHIPLYINNITTSLFENEEPSELLFTISPNPSSDFIRIESKNQIQSFKIFDATGRLKRSSSLPSIDIREWQDGVYFITAKLADNSWRNGSFIKMNH